MRIVPQSASASHSFFPTLLALPAPKPVAGLLPARVPSSIPQMIVYKKPPEMSHYERQHAIWAARDAEMEAFLEGARRRLAAAYEEWTRDRAANPGRPWVVEVPF